MKEIKNIVIYKSIENGVEIKKSCIFYSDGTTKEGSYEDGLKAIKEVTIERNITTKDELREMMNKDTFYTMTEEELKEKYDSFLPQTSSKFDQTKIDEAIEKMRRIGEEEKTPIVIEEKEEEHEVVEKTTPTKKEKSSVFPVAIPYNNKNTDIDEDHDKEYEDFTPSDEEEVVYTEEYEGDSSYESFDNDIEDDELDEEIVSTDNETIKEKIVEKAEKHPNIARAIIIGAVAIGVIAAGCVIRKCSKSGFLKFLNSKTTESTTTSTDNSNEANETEYTTTDADVVYTNNNDLYNDYTFAELLDVTTNDFQKTSMINVASSLTGFNNIFANNYLESGHDIKAALTFDEAVALQQAYNNYTNDEVRAYFNGYEVDAVNMSNNYKSASLQLMGAYVIEDSEHPVDMSILIDSQEGKDFYNKYHSMYLAAKEATGDEQLRLVNEFYKAVREDFPITEEVRTDGISHSEDHNSLEDYQLAVAPMIAAAEMIFQNLDIDYTLDDMEIDFINDIGLCNHADDKFERLETITISAYEDNENPLYTQYRNAIVAELTESNNYVIDDAHRELSNLRRFQEIVNNDPLYLHRTTYEGEYGSSYEGEYETTSWESSETSYEVVTTTEEEPITEEGQATVDAEIASENDQAREEAQAAADQEAARQQAEADQEKEVIENEVASDTVQLQDDIDDINTTINNGGTPNENDYSNIDFDDNHSNSNGDLDNSVQNVTTDGSGADEPLPDPNEYGEDFDTRVAQRSYTTYYEVGDTGYVVEWSGEDGAYIEYDDNYVSFDENGNPITSEEDSYQYTR